MYKRGRETEDFAIGVSRNNMKMKSSSAAGRKKDRVTTVTRRCIRAQDNRKPFFLG